MSNTVVSVSCFDRFCYIGTKKASQHDGQAWREATSHFERLGELVLPTVIDALFQRCAEGEGRVAKTVKGARRVFTPPILTV